MKISVHRVLTACLVFGVATLRADYATTFSSPPYAADQSVIGIDGWDYRLPPATDQSDKARVVGVRWHGYQPAMMMKGASLKNAIPPTTGGKVTLTFDLAAAFPDIGGSLKQFRLGFLGAPCGEIFIDLGGDGGLGYQADGSGRGGVVVLKKSEVKVNSFYTFTVAIDYAKKTYDVEIAGVKKDGAPFHYVARNLAFEAKSRAITGIYILSGNLTAWLGFIAIKSE